MTAETRSSIPVGLTQIDGERFNIEAILQRLRQLESACYGGSERTYVALLNRLVVSLLNERMNLLKDLADERSAREAAAPQASERIPCDVAIAPATVFGAGCDLSLVLAGIRQRTGIEPAPHFRRAVLTRVMPPGILADVAELIARDVAQLQDRAPPEECLRVTIPELEAIVRARVVEEASAG
jgi:hypothetical protein